ncbi:hypothetical protein M378DRAFT_26004 [Amanita muscaria Koide BX008]|uniref:Uncharacterized protein n=1 Tax=Amanita muscaria (strain Koide BX008) TaxID=946122 RepID=A0A0C2WJ92_AMAMK|nr:hypothetical protein M378DRAFT_26004 [Amanita muscaria Koide BX008]
MGEARREKLLNLFWALRGGGGGGGGGTFGVVVSVTYRTNDRLPLISFSLSVNLSTPVIAQNVTAEYFAMLPELSNAGWVDLPSCPRANSWHVFFVFNKSLVQGNATFSSFLASAQADVLNPQSFPSFYDAYLAFFNVTGQVGGTNEFVSLLVSLEIAKDQPEKVSKVAWEFLTVSHSFSSLVVLSSWVNPDSAGLNPAWREALGLLVSDVTWNEGSQTAEIDRLRKQAASDLEVLDTFRRIQERILTRLQDNVHYAQLKSIKHRYDNDDLFLVAQGVGSDDRVKSLTCRL